MKRRYKSANHKKLVLEHEAWLRSRGIKPGGTGKKLRAVPSAAINYTPRRPDLPPTSDVVPGGGSKPGQIDRSYEDAVEARSKEVAPAYNKGPMMHTTDADALKDSGRGRFHDGDW